MINGLKGKIIEKELDSVTLDVNNVGYKVFVSNNFLTNTNNLASSEEIYVYTYLSVRENALDLYGFLNEEDKKLFQLLLTVSGIGPKSALSVMNSVTRKMIEESVSKDDPKHLSKVSGIGKKTAEKILIGLKDKIGSIMPSSDSSKSESSNSIAIDALISIGYSERDARESVKKIDTENKDTQAIIKEALKNLN